MGSSCFQNYPLLITANKIFGLNGVWHHNVAMITQIMVKRTSRTTFISSTPVNFLHVSEFIMVMSYRFKVLMFREEWGSINFENSNLTEILTLNRKRIKNYF